MGWTSRRHGEGKALVQKLDEKITQKEHSENLGVDVRAIFEMNFK